MDYITVIITSLVSLFVLFLLTKLVGNRQLSELNMFDYIVSITIGSIAAEMATELEHPEKPLLAMAVYALISFVISVITAKSIKLRLILFGHSVVLMKSGQLYKKNKKNFKKTRLDLNEFLMQARLNGYFDLSQVDTAVMEASGKISFMPQASSRPATPEDLKIAAQADKVFYNVIMDGNILERNLKTAGRDIRWLESSVKSKGDKISDIFLATLDSSGTLNIFRNSYREKRDVLNGEKPKPNRMNKMTVWSKDCTVIFMYSSLALQFYDHNSC